MSIDRLHELWTKYLAEGVLLPEEEQELVQAFRRDPALAEQLLGDVELDGLLRALPERKEEAEAVARRFLDCVSAENDSDRFVDQVFAKITSDPPRNLPRPPRQATRRVTGRPATAPFPWRELAIAASVLLGIGIVYWILSPAPAAPPRRTPDVVQVPEPRDVPAPELPAPAPAPDEKAPEPRPVEPGPVPPEPKAPLPAPTPKPVPAPAPVPDKVEPPAPRTIASVAAFEHIEGEVFIVGADLRIAAKPGDGIPAGGSVETSAAKSSASLKFADGTRVDLGADTLLREISERQAPSILDNRPARGRRIAIVRGTVLAEIPKQPADQPMLFATPHGEARVIGTSLRLEVGKTTRLEVKEGRVRFTRNDGKKVEVAPGQFAVAGPGADLAVRPLALERRILQQWDFEDAGAAAGWELGTIDKAQTHGGSRGSLKAAFRPNEDYAVHAEMAYVAKPLPVLVTERTTITFAYYLSAPVEFKVQMRADRTKGGRNIAHILEAPKAGAWTVVTLRLTEGFRHRAGLGDLVKPGIMELDQIQFHAAPGDKPVDLYIDNVAIFE